MAVSERDAALFGAARDKALAGEGRGGGIGTLGEKTLHAALKNFYEPNDAFHEVKAEGFVADIMRNGEIIEVQTGNFNNLRKKLDVFLKAYNVTIVYPIIHEKWLYWINEKTGELSKKRKSPKRGSFYDAFYELYKIKPYLDNPNLRISLVLVDADEYRLLDGWSADGKKGSSRYDRIPKELVDELYIEGVSDYLCLMPKGLPARFTASEYARQAHIAPKYARLAVNIFSYLGIVARVGKSGRSYLYEIARGGL